MSLGPGGCPYFTAFPSPYPYYPRGRLCDPFPLRPQSPHVNNGNAAPSKQLVAFSSKTGVPAQSWWEGRRSAPPLPFSLTVQLYLIQSSQKREAENFFRITTVMPWIRHCPIPTMFPEGRGGTRGSGRQTGALSLQSLVFLFILATKDVTLFF